MDTKTKVFLSEVKRPLKKKDQEKLNKIVSDHLKSPAILAAYKKAFGRTIVFDNYIIAKNLENLMGDNPDLDILEEKVDELSTKKKK